MNAEDRALSRVFRSDRTTECSPLWPGPGQPDLTSHAQANGSRWWYWYSVGKMHNGEQPGRGGGVAATHAECVQAARRLAAAGTAGCRCARCKGGASGAEKLPTVAAPRTLVP